MNTISTHILDTAWGKPAVGVTVRLEQYQTDGWIALAEGQTNEDGRIADFAPPLAAGQYRLIAAIGAWFRAAQRETLYASAQIDFILPADGGHYHLPFLISPWSWSTYRGS
ncbi:hydroxyisourate hydrolase [Affinibrenneria salicis]|uniref:5-hydroxyisourate hydrolase n=1 Tax=Affinibrenneria salicis TaxID=2590031 RepID=A0A5J5G3A2_9GAMM|nr:hydroxyisourate hydrolase [Affinibrenneria salicis]KAA9001339.1 hydroxyisourate hydrolase [Affinibrenneria salicis]